MHLYVHVPFCARRCSYCDFAIAVRRVVPSDAFGRSVLSEWELRRTHPAWMLSDRIETVYFGGGTPSLLDCTAIGLLLDRIAGDRPMAPGAEITLEANPDDVTAPRADAWRRAGINRVSLGVQSFEPEVLRWMHRTHSAEQVPRAVELLRAAGLGSLSLDLIFALPASLQRRWEADLQAALALGPDHLSIYGLTVEEGTPLGRWTARGAAVPADDDRYALEFLTAETALTAAGYEHYEVSSYARPGRRARHNAAYWCRAPFLGLGPSAHSGWGRERQWNVREWAAYEQVLGRGDDPAAGHEVLDPAAVALEEIYLGLRTRDGLPADRLDPGLVRSWVHAGWAKVDGSTLTLTPEGWLRLDALATSAAPTAAGSPPIR